MQKVLFDYDKKEQLTPSFSIGESVRNATYQMIKPDLPEKRQRVFEVILAHPEGICAKDVRDTLHWGIQSISGRVSELHQSDPPLIEACGVTYLPDSDGKMYPNTIWRAKTV